MYDNRETRSKRQGLKDELDVGVPKAEDARRFNSLLIVDPSGDLLLNYQKRFLYYTDEPWASEGQNGKGVLSLPVSLPMEKGEQLNVSNSTSSGSSISGQLHHIHTAVGICMDINPYKFIAPYTAYEFATHVLESGSKLVILSMAWLTLLSSEELASKPKTPDTDTFRYWIKRFWPLIVRDDWDGNEIVLVFANRTGEEKGAEGKDTARYAGTSCVMAIRKAQNGDEEKDKYLDAEIAVWERLGRAEEAVCFVDTDLPPKMTFRVFKGQDD